MKTTPCRWAVLAAAASLVIGGAPAAAQEPSKPAAAAADPKQQAAETPKPSNDQEPQAPKENKRKKDAVKFVWVPHPSIRAGKQVRIDFRSRIMEEGNQTEAQAGDQS